MAKKSEAPKLKVDKHDDEDEIGVVQGLLPGSKNEWYVSLALDKLEIDYQFQVPLSGGRGIRGGQVIDFICYIPRATPVFVQGEYWHDIRSEGEDILKQAEAEQRYGVKPILLMGEETDSKDKAYKAVMEKIK